MTGWLALAGLLFAAAPAALEPCVPTQAEFAWDAALDGSNGVGFCLGSSAAEKTCWSVDLTTGTYVSRPGAPRGPDAADEWDASPKKAGTIEVCRHGDDARKTCRQVPLRLVPTDAIREVAVSANGRLLAAAVESRRGLHKGQVFLYDVATGKRLGTVKPWEVPGSERFGVGLIAGVHFVGDLALVTESTAGAAEAPRLFDPTGALVLELTPTVARATTPFHLQDDLWAIESEDGRTVVVVDAKRQQLAGSVDLSGVIPPGHSTPFDFILPSGRRAVLVVGHDLPSQLGDVVVIDLEAFRSVGHFHPPRCASPKEAPATPVPSAGSTTRVTPVGPAAPLPPAAKCVPPIPSGNACWAMNACLTSAKQLAFCLEIPNLEGAKTCWKVDLSTGKYAPLTRPPACLAAAEPHAATATRAGDGVDVCLGKDKCTHVQVPASVPDPVKAVATDAAGQLLAVVFEGDYALLYDVGTGAVRTRILPGMADFFSAFDTRQPWTLIQATFFGENLLLSENPGGDAAYVALFDRDGRLLEELPRSICSEETAVSSAGKLAMVGEPNAGAVSEQLLLFDAKQGGVQRFSLPMGVGSDCQRSMVIGPDGKLVMVVNKPCGDVVVFDPAVNKVTQRLRAPQCR